MKLSNILKIAAGAVLIPTVYVVSLLAFSNLPVAPLGEEVIPEGEQQAIDDVSKLLTDNLLIQYKDQLVLRDTHPKDNGCVIAKFVVDDDINAEYQHGVFKPGAEYNTWIRFSNSVRELTDDYEKDFRGLAMKLTSINVEGARVAIPGDEKNSQDFLFLGHDAFFAGDANQFLAFFQAVFSGKTSQFLLTHPKGALNLLQGEKRYRTPLDVHWNSVTGFALGPLKSDKKYTNVVRYAMQSCAANIEGETPSESSTDYLRTNLAEQLAMGAENDINGCFNFYIQKQLDAKDMPVENALVQWDQNESPFIKIAEVHIPKQIFTSEAQKTFCQNIAYNPGHSLVAHKPLGGINRTREQVMKAVSDLRLQQNNVQRFEPTGQESFK